MNAHARLDDARSAAAHLAALLAAEHGAMADFLLALAVFDQARGWAELGHASLFAFLQRQLRLSNGAAYHRAAAARLVQRSPAVADALRAGQLCLSSAAELAKVLTPENEATVLPRFLGLSARDAKEVVAELQPDPVPPRREVVTAVARPIPSGAEVVRTSEVPAAASPREPASPLLFAPAAIPGAAPDAPADVTPPSTSATPIAPARPSDSTDPLTADLRRLHVTVSRRFIQKLEAAREARSHARPCATSEAILEEALDLLLAREAKRREARTERPRAAPAKRPLEAAEAVEGAERRSDRSEDTRQVPAHVRREVWARDGGRCTWPLDGGGTCGSTHRLELDHLVPVARGGPSTPANLRILCEGHNKEAARRAFGASWPGRRRAAPPRRDSA